MITVRFPILLVSLLMIADTVAAGCEQLSVDTSQGMVRDGVTRLTWSRCLLGQVASGCLGQGSALSWVGALNQARVAELGGVTNWRLPKKEEFEKLLAIDPVCLEPAFPGIGMSVTWSASANLDYATDAWAFDFAKGEAVIKSRDSKLQVLLIASPK